MNRPLVLVIDDYSDAREVYEIALGLEGFAAEGARDGHEGFRRAVQLRPALIITTDLSMPRVDGWERSATCAPTTAPATSPSSPAAPGRSRHGSTSMWTPC
jgi:CheY-like chemotaxis protein